MLRLSKYLLRNILKSLTHKALVTDSDKKLMQIVPYASVIGCLIYAMVCSRPELIHLERVVSKFMKDLSKTHCNIVELIMRYLNSTKSMSSKK